MNLYTVNVGMADQPIHLSLLLLLSLSRFCNKNMHSILDVLLKTRKNREYYFTNLKPN